MTGFMKSSIYSRNIDVFGGLIFFDRSYFSLTGLIFIWRVLLFYCVSLNTQLTPIEIYHWCLCIIIVYISALNVLRN